MHLVVHHNKTDHYPDTKNAIPIQRENKSLRQKCPESASIANSSTVNLLPDFYVSPFFSQYF